METKFTREEEEAIVKLWRDNEQEMRCLVWFEKNHPRAVEWARNNVKDMRVGTFFRISGQGRLHSANICYLRPDFKLPEPERWFYNNVDHQLVNRPSPNVIHNDVTKEFGWIEVPAEYLKYVKGCIERHNKGEFDLKEYELRRLVKCETVEWISPKSYKSGIGVVYLYDGTLRFIKKPAAKPEWKEVFNNGKIRVEVRVK